MRLVLFLVLTVSFITACSSVSEPLRVGPDAYQINSISKSGLASWGEVKEMAIKRANLHCDAQDKLMVLDSEKTSGTKVWTPMEAHISYRCVPK